jgi:hypothetical protein
MKGLRKAGVKLKDLLWHSIYASEFCWNALEKAEYGRSITILDLEGIGLFGFAGEVMEFVKKAMQIVQEHYPERSYLVFLVNAPRWFSSIWTVVRPLINPETVKKIKIMSSGFEAELLKEIDESELPRRYGGTNDTPLGESKEEKLLRNIVVRGLLAHKLLPFDPISGCVEENLTEDALSSKIDPSVDYLLKNTTLVKDVNGYGDKVCDETRTYPLKKFGN